MGKTVLLLLLFSMGCRACDVGWLGASKVQVVDEREFFGEYLEVNWADLVSNVQCVESVVVELTLNQDGNLGGSSSRTERQARTLRGDPLAIENLFQYTDCQEAPYNVNVTIVDMLGSKLVHSTTLDPLKLFDSKQILVKQKAGNPVAVVFWLKNVFRDLRLREHCLRGGKLFNSRNELIQELDIMYPEVKVTSRSCKEELFLIQYDIGNSERPTKIFFEISPTDNCTNMVEESTTVATEFLDQGKEASLSANTGCNGELTWPDLANSLVCGECKVLVDNMDTKYKTCSSYCSTIGRSCTGAWEEEDGSCTEKDCHHNFGKYTSETGFVTPGGSDAICKCGEEVDYTGIYKCPANGRFPNTEIFCLNEDDTSNCLEASDCPTQGNCLDEGLCGEPSCSSCEGIGAQKLKATSAVSGQSYRGSKGVGKIKNRCPSTKPCSYGDKCGRLVGLGQGGRKPACPRRRY